MGPQGKEGRNQASGWPGRGGFFQQTCCFCESAMKPEGVGRGWNGRPKATKALMARPLGPAHRELWTLLEDLEPYPAQALYLLCLVSHSVKPFSQQTYTVQPSLPLSGGSAVHSSLTLHPCNSGPRSLTAEHPLPLRPLQCLPHLACAEIIQPSLLAPPIPCCSMLSSSVRKPLPAP